MYIVVSRHAGWRLAAINFLKTQDIWHDCVTDDAAAMVTAALAK